MEPLIIYHRGRHGTLPDGTTLKENTLSAFERAIEDGAKMIEFDVWSGLRISHDPRKESVPNLSDVLDVINGQCAVNIEIKSPAAVSDVLRKIKAALSYGAWEAEQIVLSAFHHDSAIRCKRELPQISVGVINSGVLLPSYINMLKTEGINNLHVEWVNIYMDKEAGNTMRNAAQKNNMQIWVWTVNSIEVFNTVIAYGAQAVFTDRPDLLVRKR